MSSINRECKKGGGEREWIQKLKKINDSHKEIMIIYEETNIPVKNKTTANPCFDVEHIFSHENDR